MSSRKFTVMFKNNNGTRKDFSLSDAMKKFLENLERKDISDLDFFIDGKRVLLPDLLSSKSVLDIDYVNEIYRFLRHMAVVGTNVVEEIFDVSKIWKIPLEFPFQSAPDLAICYGFPTHIGSPKPDQENCRWVKFEVIKCKKYLNSSRFNKEIWIKQPARSRYDFSKWIFKYMRIVGKLREKWVNEVFQIILDDKIAYNAGGP